jgi:hypothetical protein
MAGTIRGPLSPKAGTPIRPVLKGNGPGRRPLSPRSILRQRARRHITHMGVAEAADPQATESAVDYAFPFSEEELARCEPREVELREDSAR